MRRVATLTADGRERNLLDYLEPCTSWALSTYSDCEFRCVYCITGVQGVSTPVCPKEQVAERLRQELTTVDAHAAICVGGLCDAYPTVEMHYRVTRAAIEELVAQDWQFVIITKGSSILRDRELLASHPRAQVRVSLCSTDESALRRVDPRAPSAEERLRVIHKLATAGVRVAVSAAPWIPGVSDAQALIERVDQCIPIRFGVLNVLAPEVAATPYGKRFTQDAVNDAFIREFQRVESRPNVTWLRPVAADGSERRRHPFLDLLDSQESAPTPVPTALSP